MKTKKGEKNLKFRDGKWYLDFTFQGKRIREFAGYTKEQAKATLAKRRIEKMNEKLGFKEPEKIPDIPFEKFADEFMKLYSKKRKKSWKRDEESLKNLKPFLKGKSLQDITQGMVENYMAKRETEVSKATVNREIALLKTIFNKAVDWGKIDHNPLLRVKKFKESPKAIKILEDEEIKRLLDNASPHLKPILLIGLNTGMRRNEILGLKWENLDFRKGVISIEDSKSGKSRCVYMNTLVYETLQELPKKSEYVFPNKRTGNHIQDVKNSFKAACKDAKIAGFRFHDLRHTAATKMVEAGVDLVTISKILGHSSIQMTMRYAHSGERTMRMAADKLGKFYEQTRQKVDSPTEEVIVKRPSNHRYINN